MSRARTLQYGPSQPARGIAAGGPVELGDHPAGRLNGPAGVFGSDLPGRIGRRGGRPAVQPFRVAAVSDNRVTEGLDPLEVGGRLQLASDRSLTQVMPLGEEPSAVVEAWD